MDVSADPNVGPDGELDSFGVGVDRPRWMISSGGEPSGSNSSPNHSVQQRAAVPPVRLPEFTVPLEVAPVPKDWKVGLNTLRRGLGVAQAVWPECLDRVYILNASWRFQAMWKIFSLWMDARTRAKFVVLKGGPEQYTALHAQFEPSQLFAEHGGAGPSMSGYRERAIMRYEACDGWTTAATTAAVPPYLAFRPTSNGEEYRNTTAMQHLVGIVSRKMFFCCPWWSLRRCHC